VKETMGQTAKKLTKKKERQPPPFRGSLGEGKEREIVEIVV